MIAVHAAIDILIVLCYSVDSFFLKMRYTMKKILTCSLLLISSIAFGGNLYFGLNAGGEFNQWNKLFDQDYYTHSLAKDQTWGAGLDIGYKFNSNLAVEVGGLFTAKNVDINLVDADKTFTLDFYNVFVNEMGVLTFPADKLSFSLKAGVSEMFVYDKSLTDNNVNIPVLKNYLFIPVAGVGIDYQITDHFSFGLVNNYYFPVNENFKGMDYLGVDFKYNI